MTVRSAAGRPPPKATLYCPDCWHASPPQGDWLTQRTPGREATVCPVCDAVVVVRDVADPVTV